MKAIQKGGIVLVGVSNCSRAAWGRVGSRLLTVLVVLCFCLSAWAQTAWRTEVVDDGGGADVGMSPSLAIDRDGDFHVGYLDATHHALLYAYRNAGDQRWFKMVVDRESVGPYLSLAVDAQDRPHFSYVSIMETGLHYAFWDGKTWQKLVVDPGRINYTTQLQLDHAGNPRISYYLYHGPTGLNVLNLKYAFFDGRQWFIQTVDKHMSTGKFNSITVDSKGNPYIAYTHVGWGDLLYAHYDGTQWKFDDVDSRKTSNDYVGMGNSIAVDGTGNPHIAYFDESRNTVKYASWDGTKWSMELVDQLVARDVEAAEHVSLKFDSHNRPHVAFYDAGVGALKYAVRGEKNWRVEVVDREGNVGMTPSLVLDERDQPHIAYYDVSRHALKIAHGEASPASPAVAVRK